MSEELENNLLKYNKTQKYLIWDMETCDLNLLSLHNKPWQVGYAVATKDEIILSRNVYIKWPELKISADAARITHYDQGVVDEKGISPESALRAFDQLLYDPSIRSVFHNGFNFDYAIHNIWRKNLGFKTDYSYLKTAYDTRALYMLNKLQIPWKNNESSYFQQAKALNYRKRGFKSNLAFICRELGIKVEEEKLHSADADIILTHEVFKEMIRKMDLK